ncbi:hypothetical protein HDU92_007896 [Lobulomyces angularis]|nr:hypothetical protein HDU92_007896 [Lobulomyces angularis]
MTTLINNLDNLYSSNNFNDVTFIVGPEKIKVEAIKLLISINSPVIEKLLFNNMIETKQNVIELPNCFPEAFKILIRFMTSCLVDQTLFCNNQKLVLQVAETARYFDVPLLFEFSLKSFADNLNLKNLFECIELSKEFVFKKVENYLSFFIEKNALAILSLEETKNFKFEQLHYILKNLKNIPHQYEIVMCLIFWYKETQPSNENLKSLLDLVDFTIFNGKQLLALASLGEVGASMLVAILLDRAESDLVSPEKKFTTPLQFERLNEYTATNEYTSFSQETETVLANRHCVPGTITTWDIEVIDVGGAFWVGICTDQVDRKKFGGRQPFGWLYSANDRRVHNNKEEPKLGLGETGKINGGILRLSLDLQNENRKLLISKKLNNSEKFSPSLPAFQNLPDYLYFFPAISVRIGSVARISQVE